MKSPRTKCMYTTTNVTLIGFNVLRKQTQKLGSVLLRFWFPLIVWQTNLVTFQVGPNMTHHFSEFGIQFLLQKWCPNLFTYIIIYIHIRIYTMPCSYQTCKKPEITTNMHRKPPRLSGSHRHPWVLQTPIQWVPLSHDLNVLCMSILDTSAGDLGGIWEQNVVFQG